MAWDACNPSQNPQASVCCGVWKDGGGRQLHGLEQARVKEQADFLQAFRSGVCLLLDVRGGIFRSNQTAQHLQFHRPTKKNDCIAQLRSLAMHPLIASARFAAFVWYKEQQAADSDEASRYAREHWPEFLAAAHEGLGLLLMKIAEPAKSNETSRPSKRQSSRKQLAKAG